MWRGFLSFLCFFVAQCVIFECFPVAWQGKTNSAVVLFRILWHCLKSTAVRFVGRLAPYMYSTISLFLRKFETDACHTEQVSHDWLWELLRKQLTFPYAHISWPLVMSCEAGAVFSGKFEWVVKTFPSVQFAVETLNPKSSFRYLECNLCCHSLTKQCPKDRLLYDCCLGWFGKIPYSQHRRAKTNITRSSIWYFAAFEIAKREFVFRQTVFQQRRNLWFTLPLLTCHPPLPTVHGGSEVLWPLWPNLFLFNDLPIELQRYTCILSGVDIWH